MVCSSFGLGSIHHDDDQRGFFGAVQTAGADDYFLGGAATDGEIQEQAVDGD
jgi:hypothetical protein